MLASQEFFGKFLLIFFIFFDISNGAKMFKIHFNLHFKCGPYHGAEGRLFIRYDGSGIKEFKNYYPLLEVVLDKESNGIFNRTLIVPAILGDVQTFQLLFRTNCYIMNRFGECCAHDYKFIAYVDWGGKGINSSWLYSSDFHREFTLKRVRPGYPKTYFNRNCTFHLTTRNPNTHQIVVDLRELLLDIENYKDKFFVNYIGPPFFWKKTGLTISTYRHCTPYDDENKEMQKNFEASNQKWEICAHPNYGYHGPPSFELGHKYTDEDMIHDCHYN